MSYNIIVCDADPRGDKPLTVYQDEVKRLAVFETFKAAEEAVRIIFTLRIDTAFLGCKIVEAQS